MMAALYLIVITLLCTILLVLLGGIYFIVRGSCSITEFVQELLKLFGILGMLGGMAVDTWLTPYCATVTGMSPAEFMERVVRYAGIPLGAILALLMLFVGLMCVPDVFVRSDDCAED